MMENSTWKLSESRFQNHGFESEIKQQLSKLRPDNYSGALYVLKDYLVIAVCVVITLNVSWYFYPIAVLLIGVHQRGLTTIAHDAAHRTLAKSSAINYAIGIIFASYPLFQRHWAYRISHVHLHHPYLGNPEKDPDLKFFIQSDVYKVCHPFNYAMKIIIFPLLGGATFGYLKFLFTTRFKVMNDNGAPEERLASQIEFLVDTIGFYGFWLLVFGLAVWFNALDEIVLFWIIPYLTTFQMLGWFIEIAEHSPMCEVESTNIYLTRNRKGNLLERLLFGVNLDEYHLEHHLSPGIPFWHLKKAQEIRRLDPEYDAIAKTWGGLFCKGPDGQSSVIRQLLVRNEKRYWSKVYGAEIRQDPGSTVANS